MLETLKDFIKRIVAGKELDALHRYRMACHCVHRWNGSVPGSSETATWIADVGEGNTGMDIEGFRTKMFKKYDIDPRTHQPYPKK